MDSDLKFLLACLAIAMTVAAHIPYLVTTLKGSNKPHIFTWILWTLLTFIAFAAQMAGNAGPGAWVTGITGIICIIITVATFHRGEKNITRSDWIMFIVGMAAIPLWMLTSNPVWSVIIITVIDCIAFWPTFRKSWHKPHEENAFMYGFNIPRHVISIASLSVISITTTLYPAALLLMNVIMYGMLKWRAAKLKASHTPT